MKKEQREFRTDALKLKRLRVQFGLTIEKFWHKAELDKATAQKLFRGGPVSLTTLVETAKVFRIANHLELLHPDELAELGIDPELSPGPDRILEWDVESRLTGWEKTTNGLHYQLARLRHRFRTERLARGKCYELRHLSVKDRKPLEEHLCRHVEVCERIGKHPNIAENYTAAFVESGGLWWVVDRWEEGQTLKDRLNGGPLELAHLRTVMIGIAEGLHTLHRAEVIRRELSPRFIQLRTADQSPVLTDFELAKLSEGKPTVAPNGGWPDDPYRALEVTGEGSVDARADVFSWGKVFIHAATGNVPAKTTESAELDGVQIPDGVRELVRRSIAKARSGRPENMTEILKVMKRWRI